METLTSSIVKARLELFFEKELKIPPETMEEWFEKNIERAAGLQAGTHISKGVHSSSKGSNFTFKPNGQELSHYLGTHSIDNPQLDVTGNGASITLMRVVTAPVSEEKMLYDLLISDDKALDGVFSKDKERPKAMQQALKEIFINDEETMLDGDWNKMIIWPVAGCDSIDDDRYYNLIPLHASALIYAANQRINQRYSEELKAARKARQDWQKLDPDKKEQRAEKLAELKPYFNFQNLARVQLGGAHPRNVGLHTHNLFGRNHLLPSFPPTGQLTESYYLHTDSKTIFDSRLSYHCRKAFRELEIALRRVQYHDKINIDIKLQIRDALDTIFYQIIQVIEQYQRKPAGWSDDYKLALVEKHWLDPDNPRFEEKPLSREEIEQLSGRIQSWITEIIQRNPKLTSLLSSQNIADTEYREWLKMLKITLFSSLNHLDDLPSEEVSHV